METTKLTIHLGSADLYNSPLYLAGIGNAEHTYVLSLGELQLPAQYVDGGLWCLVPELPAGRTANAVLHCVDVQHPERVSVEESEDRIGIYTDGKLLTAYIKAGNPARPCFYPLRAPGASSITRHWPMRHDIPGETNDHVHHRSMWVAFGDVNGVDNWSEEPGHGYTLHRQTLNLFSGVVCGGFETLSDWTDAQNNELLKQYLKVRVFPLPNEEHLIDVEVALTAVKTDIRFGDTKEGGILSVRVASSIDVPRGGRIENSEGGINEPQTWGKRADWCDYSGFVEGVHAGIAIMQHPDSFRHPAWWHVRDYGLMTVNPFGLAAFTGGREHGDYLLPRGETLRWRFRVYIHRGDATQGCVAVRWREFIQPPIVAGLP